MDPSGHELYAELNKAWTELVAPGAHFEITETVVRGDPVREYKNAHPNLRVLWQSTAQYGARDYLVFEGARWDYERAQREVASVAGWLFERGLVPGDRVAIAMRNYPEWMLAYWACVSTGLVVVGLNAWWSGPELAYGIRDSDPRAIIADTERVKRICEQRQEVGDRIIVGVRVREDLAGVIPFDEICRGPAELPEVQIDPDDDACLFYTSGTTGKPKGARLTHRGCANNVMSMAYAAAVQARAMEAAGQSSRAATPSSSAPAALITTPLFHVTANNCVAQAMTAAGGKLVLMYKWDPGEALRLAEEERVTSLGGVPMMARELIAHPDFSRRDLSSVRTLGGGGAALQPDLVRKIDEALESVRPTTGYGMTETCGIVTSVNGDFLVRRPRSVGRALPCFETRIVDENGCAVPMGEPGELWVRGAQVIKGYWNQPEATAEAIRDGWLRTGDIARLDEDGFIYIVDRAKDMVLRGGENIYCAEVEAAIFEHDGIAECAVFGVPDDRFGEEVGAALVLAERAAPISVDALRAFLADRLAAYKIPRYIWVLEDALPRNANGKFLKRELQERLDPADAS
jgi:long-chain acyl-CoA synthetase